MPIVSLDLVTLDLVRECGTIYVEDRLTCQILRKDKRLSLSEAPSEEARLLLGDLRIQVDELTPEAFDAVRAELIALGVKGPWQSFWSSGEA
ncbi:hypothetical protein V1318_02025 [Lysobacter sp. CCNWLW3]|uniref:hypothetical protein n=1 Tax=unclassified Lysobacter TaxID=2635362 RepID=UPI002FD25ECC